MVRAAFKLMRLCWIALIVVIAALLWLTGASYRLLSVLLVITTGAWCFMIFRLVAVQLIRRMRRRASARRQNARDRKGKIARDGGGQERDVATDAASPRRGKVALWSIRRA